MELRRMGPWGPAALLLVAAPAAWGQVPRGGEIAVNEYTTGFRRYPAIASGTGGGFTIVWEDSGHGDGSGHAVRARRFGADGQPLAPSFVVNTFTTGDQQNVSVASDAAGNMIVAWHSPQDGSGLGIYARRFDPSGNPIGGSEFRVNASTTGFQRFPEVALGDDGGFVVTWTGDDAGSLSIFARKYNAAGLPTTATDVAVNTSPSLQQDASVASDTAGNFVVTWQGYGSGDEQGIFTRRYDVSGAASPPFRVNTYTTADQEYGAVAIAGNGDFVIAWDSDDDGNLPGIFAQRFSPDVIFRDDFESGSLGRWSGSTRTRSTRAKRSSTCARGSSSCSRKRPIAAWPRSCSGASPAPTA